MSNLYLILFFIISFYTSVALSAPSVSSVSGTISDGQTITITGSGFGAAGPTIHLFDDFSGGSVGSVHPASAVIGTWDNTACIVYADAALSQGKGARCIGTPGQLGSRVEFTVTDEVFISSAAYVPPGYKFPSASTTQTFPDVSAMKHFWLMYGSDGYSNSTKPDIYSPNYTGGGFYRVSSNDGQYGLSTFDTNHDIAWAWDIPMRWSLWAKGNGTSVSGSDGMWQGISATGGHTTASYKDYKAWFDPNHVVQGWDRLALIGYARSGADFNDGHNWVVDDVYVATGPNAAARVEIGNAATYTASTNLALSTPTTWSDTSIAVTVRQGRFANGATAYIYVIDKDNAVSASYEITIGAGAGGDIISPVLSALLPSGNDGWDGSGSVSLQVTTDEDATCRFGAVGATWAQMSEMSMTGTQSHSQALLVRPNTNYRRHILCQDAATNQSNAGLIKFHTRGPSRGRPLPFLGFNEWQY